MRLGHSKLVGLDELVFLRRHQVIARPLRLFLPVRPYPYCPGPLGLTPLSLCLPVRPLTCCCSCSPSELLL